MNEYVDWLAEKTASLPNEVLPPPKYAEDFFKTFSPAVDEYYCPITPIFLVQCVTLLNLNLRDAWLIRDGAIPLRQFFLAHPQPPQLHAKLYIEESLAGLVPRAWRASCGTYRIVSTVAPGSTRKVLLCGMNAYLYQTLDELERQLAQLDTPQFRAQEKHISLPARHFAYDDIFHFEYYQMLTEKLGADLKPYPWYRLSLTASFSDFEFIELSNKRLCADSLFAHVVLARGASYAGQPLAPGEVLTPLSPFHGFVFKDQITTQPAPIFRETHGDPLPWAEWFADWSRL